jgi:Rps23 Pro-64 3,4-dihydroxylase Tpa1-like proline 4-hydroxylase
VYLEKNYKAVYGGHLGFWEHNKSQTSQPGKLIKEIFPKYNRAIIFDTSQNSWHGLSRKLIYQKIFIEKVSLFIIYART